MAISEIIEGGKAIVGLFEDDPSPEEQRAKAGVWYNMLDDWVNNQPQNSTSFGSKWVDLLPFRQKKTKERFIAENINNKSNNDIVTTLVGKINDELVKGGFPMQSQSAILAGMGAGGVVGDTSGSSSSSGGFTALKTSGSLGGETMEDVNEGRTFFYVVALAVVAVLVMVFAFRPKRRTRRY
jgi:hypothetical protein